MPDQANYENKPQTERVRAPESIEKVVQQYVGAELRVFIDPLVPDGTAYVMPDDFGDQLRVTQKELEAMPSWRERYREILAELPDTPAQATISITAAEHPDHAEAGPLLPPPYTRAGHTLGTMGLEPGHPNRETHQQVGCSCGWVATIAKRPGAAEAWFDSHVDAALEAAERARMSPSQQKYYVAPEELAKWEAQAAAEFRPRSDEAADLRVGSGLHDRYLLLKGDPIGAIWKAGWAERLVDAVRQMELHPEEIGDDIVVVFEDEPTLSLSVPVTVGEHGDQRAVIPAGSLEPRAAFSEAVMRGWLEDDLDDVWSLDGSMSPEDIARSLVGKGWRR